MSRSSSRVASSGSSRVGRRGVVSRPGGVLLAGAASGLLCLPALAGPTGEKVVSGSATFDRSGGLTTITTSQTAIIEFSSFNIGAGETVQFVQPGVTSRVLNRIDSALPTQIDGSLLANGTVFLVNPAGVFFGQNAVVDVGQIYAAAGNISNSDFLNGVNRFTDLSGSVVNEGFIRAESGVHLLGAAVRNFGTIVAPEGMVTLSSGDDVLIGERGGRVFARIIGSPEGGIVENRGVIDARGGQAAIGVGDHVALALRMGSRVSADRITVSGGEGSSVEVAGELDASGVTGGTVQVTGGAVTLAETAVVDASGAAGGGRVEIGGGLMGSGFTENAELARASTLDVLPGARVDVSATGSGDAGTAILWSDLATRFAGSVAARGAGAGDGGFVEVSGGKGLSYRGSVDVSADLGVAGTLLLDPDNIIIQDANTATGTTAADVDGVGDAAGDLVLGLNELNALLAAPGTLQLVASQDITFSNTSGGAAIDGAGGGFTVRAGDEILFTGDGSITNVSVLTLQATTGITFSDAFTISAGSGTINTAAYTGNAGESLSFSAVLTITNPTGGVFIGGGGGAGDVAISAAEFGAITFDDIALNTSASGGDIGITDDGTDSVFGRFGDTTTALSVVLGGSGMFTVTGADALVPLGVGSFSLTLNAANDTLAFGSGTSRLDVDAGFAAQRFASAGLTIDRDSPLLDTSSIDAGSFSFTVTSGDLVLNDTGAGGSLLSRLASETVTLTTFGAANEIRFSNGAGVWQFGSLTADAGPVVDGIIFDGDATGVSATGGITFADPVRLGSMAGFSVTAGGALDLSGGGSILLDLGASQTLAIDAGTLVTNAANDINATGTGNGVSLTLDDFAGSTLAAGAINGASISVARADVGANADGLDGLTLDAALFAAFDTVGLTAFSAAAQDGSLDVTLGDVLNGLSVAYAASGTLTLNPGVGDLSFGSLGLTGSSIVLGAGLDSITTTGPDGSGALAFVGPVSGAGAGTLALSSSQDDLTFDAAAPGQALAFGDVTLTAPAGRQIRFGPNIASLSSTGTLAIAGPAVSQNAGVFSVAAPTLLDLDGGSLSSATAGLSIDAGAIEVDGASLIDSGANSLSLTLDSFAGLDEAGVLVSTGGVTLVAADEGADNDDNDDLTLDATLLGRLAPGFSGLTVTAQDGSLAVTLGDVLGGVAASFTADQSLSLTPSAATLNFASLTLGGGSGVSLGGSLTQIVTTGGLTLQSATDVATGAGLTLTVGGAFDLTGGSLTALDAGETLSIVAGSLDTNAADDVNAGANALAVTLGDFSSVDAGSLETSGTLTLTLADAEGDNLDNNDFAFDTAFFGDQVSALNVDALDGSLTVTLGNVFGGIAGGVTLAADGAVNLAPSAATLNFSSLAVNGRNGGATLGGSLTQLVTTGGLSLQSATDVATGGFLSLSVGGSLDLTGGSLTALDAGETLIINASSLVTDAADEVNAGSNALNVILDDFSGVAAGSLETSGALNLTLADAEGNNANDNDFTLGTAFFGDQVTQLSVTAIDGALVVTLGDVFGSISNGVTFTADQALTLDPGAASLSFGSLTATSIGGAVLLGDTLSAINSAGTIAFSGDVGATTAKTLTSVNGDITFNATTVQDLAFGDLTLSAANGQITFGASIASISSSGTLAIGDAAVIQNATAFAVNAATLLDLDGGSLTSASADLTIDAGAIEVDAANAVNAGGNALVLDLDSFAGLDTAGSVVTTGAVTLRRSSTGDATLSRAAVDSIDGGAASLLVEAQDGSLLVTADGGFAGGFAGGVTLDATGTLTLDPTAAATLTFSSLTADGGAGISLGVNLTGLTTTAGDLRLEGPATSVSSGGLALNAGASDVVLTAETGRLDATGVSGGAVSLVGGTIFADTGDISVGGNDLLVQATSLGAGLASQSIVTTGGGALTLRQTAGDITINAALADLVNGTFASQEIDAQAGSITVTAAGSFSAVTGSLTLRAQNTIDLGGAGSIDASNAAGGTTLVASGVVADAGDISVGGNDLLLEVQSFGAGLANGSVLATGGGALTLRQTAGDLTVNAALAALVNGSFASQTFDAAAGDLLVPVAGAFGTVTGALELRASGAVDLTGGSIDGSMAAGGVTIVAGSLVTTAADQVNAGANALSVTLDSFSSTSAGSLETGGTLTLTLADAEGDNADNNDFAFDTAYFGDQVATLVAAALDGDLIVTTGDVFGGIANGVTLTADGTVRLNPSAATLNFTTLTASGANGGVSFGGSLTELAASGDLFLQSAADVATGAGLVLDVEGTTDLTGGSIAATDAGEDLTIETSALIAGAGGVNAGGNALTLTLGGFGNAGGTLANGSLVGDGTGALTLRQAAGDFAAGSVLLNLIGGGGFASQTLDAAAGNLLIGEVGAFSGVTGALELRASGAVDLTGGSVNAVNAAGGVAVVASSLVTDAANELNAGANTLSLTLDGFGGIFAGSLATTGTLNLTLADADGVDDNDDDLTLATQLFAAGLSALQVNVLDGSLTVSLGDVLAGVATTYTAEQGLSLTPTSGTLNFGSLTLSAGTSISLGGSLSQIVTAGDLRVQQAATLDTGAALALNAGGALDFTGGSLAATDAGEDLTLAGATITAAGGAINAGGNALAVSAANLSGLAAGSLVGSGGGSVAITQTTGDLTLDAALLALLGGGGFASQTFDALAGDLDVAGAGLFSGQDITLTLRASGELDLTGGSIDAMAASGGVTVDAGTIATDAAADIDATGRSLAVTLDDFGASTFTAGSLLGSTISLTRATAGTFLLEQGLISALGGHGTLAATATNGDLNVTADSGFAGVATTLTATGGDVILDPASAGTTLTFGSLVTIGDGLTLAADLAAVNAANELDIRTAATRQGGEIELIAGTVLDFTAGGSLVATSAGQNVTLTAGELRADAGDINAGGNSLTLALGGFGNVGGTLANGSLLGSGAGALTLRQTAGDFAAGSALFGLIGGGGFATQTLDAAAGSLLVTEAGAFSAVTGALELRALNAVDLTGGSVNATNAAGGVSVVAGTLATDAVDDLNAGGNALSVTLDDFSATAAGSLETSGTLSLTLADAEGDNGDNNDFVFGTAVFGDAVTTLNVAAADGDLTVTLGDVFGGIATGFTADRAVVLNPAAATLNFGSLTLAGGTGVSFAGGLSQINALGSLLVQSASTVDTGAALTLNAGGMLDLTGGSITSDGAGEDLTLIGGSLRAGAGGVNVGGNALAVTSADFSNLAGGSLVGNGAGSITVTAPAGDLTINPALLGIIGGGGFGTQSYVALAGDVDLLADTGLENVAASLTASGDVLLDPVTGGTTLSFGSLAATGATITLAGDLAGITTTGAEGSGALSFNGRVTATGGKTLTATNDDIAFNAAAPGTALLFADLTLLAGGGSPQIIFGNNIAALNSTGDIDLQSAAATSAVGAFALNATGAVDLLGAGSLSAAGAGGALTIDAGRLDTDAAADVNAGGNALIVRLDTFTPGTPGVDGTNLFAGSLVSNNTAAGGGISLTLTAAGDLTLDGASLLPALGGAFGPIAIATTNGNINWTGGNLLAGRATTLNAAGGTLTFNPSVGALTFASLNASGGAIVLGGDVDITTSGLLAFNTPTVTVNGNHTLSTGGGALTFSPGSLLATAAPGTGSVLINAGGGAVSIGSVGTPGAALGAFNIASSGGVTYTGGGYNAATQSYTTAGTHNIAPGGGPVTFTGGSVTFTGGATSGGALTINATAAAAAGSIAAGGPLEITAPTITLNGTAYSTGAGGITLAGATNLTAGGITSFTLGGGDLSFNANPTIAGGIEVAGGTTAFGAAVTDIDATTQSYEAVTFAGGDITFTGDDVTITGGLTGPGGASSATFEVQDTLTLADAGAIATLLLQAASFDISGSINATTTQLRPLLDGDPLALGSGGVAFAPFASTSVTFGGDGYGGAVTIGADGQTVAGDTLVQTGGQITLSGATGLAVGAGVTLTLDGASAVFNTGIASSGSSTIRVESAALIGGPATFDAGGGEITFLGGINGAAPGVGDLTLIAGNGTLTLGGAIGDTTPLASFTLTSAGPAAFGSSITTTGDQTFTAPSLTLDDGVVLTAGEGATVTLDGAVALGGALTINAGAGSAAGGSVVFTEALSGSGASLLVDAGAGSVTLPGIPEDPAGLFASLDVTGGTITLGSDLGVTGRLAISGGSLIDGSRTFSADEIFITGTLDPTVDDASLTLTTVGDTVIDAVLGGVTPLAAFNGSASGVTTLTGGVFATGGITFPGALVVSGVARVETFNPSVEATVVFESTVDGDGTPGSSLTVVTDRTSGGLLGDMTPDFDVPLIIFEGPVGSLAQLDTLNLNFDGADVDGRDFVPINSTLIFGDVDAFLADPENLSPVTINVGSFAMGAREKLLSLGDFTLNASATATARLGDITALGSLTINSPNVILLSREPGLIFDPTTELTDTDFGTDFVATGPISVATLTQIINVGGAASSPVFSTPGADISLTTTGPSVIFQAFPEATASQFARAGTGSARGTFAFTDVQADGASNTDVAQALAGAAPTEAGSEVPDADAGVSEAAAEVLRRIGIAPRDARSGGGTAAPTGVAVYNDLAGDAEAASAANQTSTGRLNEEIVTRLAEDYNALFFEESVGEDGASQSVNRAGEIRDLLDAAAEQYYEVLVERTGNEDAPIEAEPFLAYLRGRSAEDPRAGEALETIDSLQRLFTLVRLLGLAESEVLRVRQAIFGEVKPEFLANDEFLALIERETDALSLLP